MSCMQCHSRSVLQIFSSFLKIFTASLKMNFIFVILSLACFNLCFGHISDTTPNPFRFTDVNDVIENNASEPSQKARLGIPLTFGSDLQGYGVNSPVKIELGGVFLGTLLGLGVALLAPKVAHIFSTPHQQYYGNAYSRSDEGTVSGISKLLHRVDQTLQENHISSIECLERAACSYMQMSSSQVRHQLLQDSSNSFINFIIDGSKLKSALKKGESGENCSTAYPQCKFSKNMLFAGITKMLGSN